MANSGWDFRGGQWVVEASPCPGALHAQGGTPQPTQPGGHSPALRARFPLFAAMGKAEKKGTLGTASCPGGQC